MTSLIAGVPRVVSGVQSDGGGLRHPGQQLLPRTAHCGRQLPHRQAGTEEKRYKLESTHIKTAYLQTPTEVPTPSSRRDSVTISYWTVSDVNGPISAL
jgi:hypothetical protein